MDFAEIWKNIRTKAVPIVAVECADPVQVGQIIAKDESPVIAWDIIRGFCPIPNTPDAQDTIGKFANKKGAEEISDLIEKFSMPAQLTAEPVTAIDFLRMCVSGDRPATEGIIVVMIGAHKLLDSSSGNNAGYAKILQAIYNLRDLFCSTGSTLVLLGTSFQLPADLSNDIYLVSYPLPTEDERRESIQTICKDAKYVGSTEDIEESVYATKGLTPFATEQAVALSLKKSSLNIAQVRQWWTKAINAQKGLSVVDTMSTLDDIAGLDNFKSFARKLVNGTNGPGAIIWIDEIEKAMAGAQGDNTGVSQDILGQILTHMQESEADGLIAAGPPGVGKSMGAVALGSAGNKPTIALDLGGLKAGIVGESEQNVRAALKTIKALAGQAFWVATCNSLAGIRPELKRRFTYGIWYFDLPDEIESEALWTLYRTKYKITSTELPEDYTGWTGAEIKTACKTASKMNITPREAAQWIVPVCQSAAVEIKALRDQANGKYTSASYSGPYLVSRVSESKRSRRRINTV